MDLAEECKQCGRPVILFQNDPFLVLEDDGTYENEHDCPGPPSSKWDEDKILRELKRCLSLDYGFDESDLDVLWGRFKRFMIGPSHRSGFRYTRLRERLPAEVWNRMLEFCKDVCQSNGHDHGRSVHKFRQKYPESFEW